MAEDQAKPEGLSWAEIFAQDDTQWERVEVPEWGTHVYLRTLPANPGMEIYGQIEALQPPLTAAQMLEKVRLALKDTLYDARKEKIPAEHIEKLQQRQARVIARLAKRALELQGWLGEEVKNASGEAVTAASPIA